MQNKIGLVELTKQIEALPLNSRGRRQFTNSVREQVVAYADRRRKEGASQALVAREVGVHQTTFSGWLRTQKSSRKGRQSSKPTPMRRVEVKETPRRDAVAVVFPSGVRIEGLELDQLVMVAKALS